MSYHGVSRKLHRLGWGGSRGDIPTISDFIKDHGASSEPDQLDNGTIPITMPTIQHAVYKNEAKNKVAFIFTNASRNQSVDFSFDIDPAKYGLGNNLSISELTYAGNKVGESITRKTTKYVTLNPLESIAFLVSK